jgi:hypothetical protein
METATHPFTQSLFWDINLAELDLEKHEVFILKRVFERGDIDQIRFIFKYYGLDRISAFVESKPRMDKRGFSFAENLVLGMKENNRTDFCY